MLDIFNSVIINFALIISSTLLLYFISIKNSLDNRFPSYNHLIVDYRLSLSRKNKVFLGIMLGVISFVISLNGVTIFSKYTVDLRYLPIFFSVYYGSPLIGAISTLLSLVLKICHYIILGATNVHIWNNLLSSVLLFLTACIIYYKKLEPKTATFVYLASALSLRAIILFFWLYPIWMEQKILYTAIYLSVFSFVFLFTSWLINKIIRAAHIIGSYQYASSYDALTGLLNKPSFDYYIQHTHEYALEKNSPYALAIIDVDDFKIINDTLGHLSGDEALFNIATALRQPTNNDQTIQLFRVGGDEMAIIFQNLDVSPEEYLKMSIRSIKELDSMTLSISIGLTYFTSTTESYKVMIEQADSALYQAKRQGKNSLVVYS